MGESAKHRELVGHLYQYVCQYVEEGTSCLVCADGPQSNDSPRSNPDGFRPDVEYFCDGVYVVGDAKTVNDLDTEHSRLQYESYFRECELAEASLFVIAVPFNSSEQARALIHNMQVTRKSSIQYAIVNEGGVYYESE